ncbi:MAG: glycosyltransferase family 39 protein [Candidatus Sumerlaeaceae bacterium]
MRFCLGEPLDRHFWWVVVVAMLSAGARAWVANRLELFQDESLYWYIGVFAPLTFSPHPPGLPLIARFGAALFGKTELAIRFGNVVLGSLALPLFYFLGRRILASSAVAWLATLAFALTPIYFAFGAICTPDMPQLFFWVALLYATWRAIEGEELWWVLVGALFGVGLYFKYILILYAPALVIYFLWSGELWRALHSRFFRLGVFLALLLFFPVAVWREAQTGWDALAYHLRDRQDFDFSPLRNGFVYFAVHLAYYSPLFYVGAIAGIVASAWRAWRQRDWRLAYLATFGAVPFLFFASIAFFTRRELSREQWDAPAYVAGLIAAAWLVRELMHGARTRVARLRFRALVQVAFVLAALTVAIVTTEAFTTLPSKLLGFRPLFSAMEGGRALARRVDAIRTTLPAEAHTVVLGNSFIPAMQYAFYSKSTPKVFTLEHKHNRRYGLRGIIERTGMSMRDLAQRTGVDAIFVASGGPNEDSTRKLAELKQRLLQYFEAVEVLPPLPILTNGREIGRFYLLYCRRLYISASPSSRAE